MTGKVHSVFAGGTVDGPGIRFVVFMQGCPLRCKYCHNPDSWVYSGGEERTTDDLFSEIIKYKTYFGSEGGVTVSGGEPLLQLDFIIELFKKLKERGINTCVDTSGYTFNEKQIDKYEELASLTDLFLLDIKHIDDEGHKALTGVSNKNTLAFSKFLSERGSKMWIRHVIVEGYTDDDGELNRLVEYVRTLKSVEKIEVLPYHTMGVVKYEKLGIGYPLKGVEPPSKERIIKIKEILKLK